MRFFSERCALRAATKGKTFWQNHHFFCAAPRSSLLALLAPPASTKKAGTVAVAVADCGATTYC
jgi:hypothetical protein